MATKKQLEPVAPAADKKKALAAALGQIEKQFGKGSVMRLGENTGMNIEHIPTGSIGLDLALDIGGLPRGRIIEIYGPESSGKTTVALHSVAEAQKLGGTAAFIDAEHALDPVYAKALGVDIDSLLVSQPDTGEQGLDIAEALVRSGAIDIVVIDSVAALTPRAEIEGEMGDSFVGLHARMMSQAMRKLAGSIAKSQCVAIFINQLREKVGVIYGNPEVTTGGRALKFYASVRMEVRRVEHLKNGTENSASSTNPARGSPWAIPVWVRAVMLPSSISRIIRTSRMTYRSRSWKRLPRSAASWRRAMRHVLPLLCRPRRPKSLRIRHRVRRPPRRSPSTRTILTTSTKNNERG